MTKVEEQNALEFARKVAIIDRDELLKIEPKRQRLARVIEYKGHRFCLLYSDLKEFCKMIGDNKYLFNKEGDRDY